MSCNLTKISQCFLSGTDFTPLNLTFEGVEAFSDFEVEVRRRNFSGVEKRLSVDNGLSLNGNILTVDYNLFKAYPNGSYVAEYFARINGNRTAILWDEFKIVSEPCGCNNCTEITELQNFSVKTESVEVQVSLSNSIIEVHYGGEENIDFDLENYYQISKL